MGQAPATHGKTDDESTLSVPPRGIARFLRPEVLTWAAILLGIALRLNQFLAFRSLWYDEALHALHILGQPVDRAIDPPTTPAGFAWMVAGVASALGTSEGVLRLVSLLASVASLFALRRLASRLLPAAGVPLAVLLLAVGAMPVYYAAELKPNSVDILVVIVLLDAWLTPPGATTSMRRWAGLAVLGAAVVWVSHPAILVLAGIGVAGALRVAVRREWTALPPLLCIGALWLLSFGGHWRVGAGALAGSDFLLDTWSDGFAPFPPTTLAHWAWYFRSSNGLLESTAGMLIPGAGAVAIGAGLLSLRRRSRWSLALLLLPVVVVLVASMKERYPIGGRTVLFLVPIVVLLAAEGVAWVGALAPPRSASLARLLALLVAGVQTCATSFTLTQGSMEREDMNGVVDRIEKEFAKGDQVYVYYGALPAWRYLRDVRGRVPFPVMEGIRSREDPDAYARDFRDLKRGRRLWLVFSHVHEGPKGNEESMILSMLPGHLQPAGGRAFAGASVHLFE